MGESLRALGFPRVLCGHLSKNLSLPLQNAGQPVHAKIRDVEGIIRDLGLFYTDQSPTTTPAKEVVVFIHGFPFNQTMWDAQAALLKKDCRVITYDQRGHGKSKTRNQPYIFEALIDDLFLLFDHLKVSKAILCGLSMGGYVALRATERAPERVSGLVLCDTKSQADTNVAKLNRSADLTLIQQQGLPAFAEKFLKALLTPTTFESNPSLVEKVRQMILSNP